MGRVPPGWPAPTPMVLRPGRNEPSTLAVGQTWCHSQENLAVNNIIWIIGAVVVVLAILSFLGLR